MYVPNGIAGRTPTPGREAMVGEFQLGETAMMLGSRREVPDVLEALDVAVVLLDEAYATVGADAGGPSARFG